MDGYVSGMDYRPTWWLIHGGVMPRSLSPSLIGMLYRKQSTDRYNETTWLKPMF